MIRKQPPRKLKKQNSHNGVDKHDSKEEKEPNKTPRQSDARQQTSAEDDRVPKTRQWTNSTIEPIIKQQAGNPGSFFLSRNVHHTILQLPAQLNVINKDTLFTHFKSTRPFIADHAMPLHTTPGLGPAVPDLMVRALHTKHAYHRELEGLEKRYKNVTSKHPLDPNAGEEVQHTVAVVYAAMLDRDPDPYLQVGTGYDYHFTGGTLVVSDAQRSDRSRCIATLFKAIGATLEDVEVVRVEVSKEEEDFHCHGDLKVSERQTCPTVIGGPILEIVPDDGANNVVLVRKRNAIIVLRQMEAKIGGGKEWRAVQNIFSTNPFASVCFVTGSVSSCGTIILCTTDYQRQLQLWTVSDEEESCEDIVKLPKLSTINETANEHRNHDKWSAVRCVDREHYLVACLDRRSLHFYSIKQNESLSSVSDAQLYRLVHRGATHFSQWTYECEQCCALEVTPSERLLFIATCHKVIVGSIEAEPSEQAESLTVKVLLVFTHNLMQKPVFISHQLDGDGPDKEHHFVLFGSHLPMSYGLAHFTRTVSDASSPVYAARHYPYHPPTFHASYKLAQTRGFCISAYEPLRKRFDACQSGAVLIRGLLPEDETQDRRLHILLQTSSGDLLQQRLTYNFDREEETPSDETSDDIRTQKTATVLQHWHDMLVKQAGRQLPYRATGFKTMSKFRDIFNCPVDGDELSRILFLPPEPKRKRNRRKVTDNGEEEEEETSQSEKEDDYSNGVDDEGELSSCSLQMKRSVERRRRKHGNKAPLPWRQTVEQLQQYRDVLAPAMLAVWGIDVAAVPGQSTNLEQIPTKLPPLADVNERIGSWVNGTISGSHEQPDENDNDSAVGLDVCAPNRTKIGTDRDMPAQEEEFVNDRDNLFSPPFTSTQQSQTLTGSQLSQSARRLPRKMYSKGF
ncbi:uncharacterized protein LOC126565937 [Anopheles maculipalpis]|uniref:uncharacterized protein LOC126565937 n=1 Tax=Anopheles maculipalpis TaxID=1496333 RepID=UPI002159AFAB|nr:uncharacterized protein LOC126565937 [Anopheles maculipalpis]